ncbi:pyruvate,water dikinase [Murinocardiopsis flavida]|uniref:Pyruvate,water dikinase n=1 Tax=Murinocardiopsis flavida TaxID=645275 RepID=A0A2P8DMH9_9ACTN|nr:PEP/pyruvate-binding domain-containing protein [Murinocardiopsis flavida]PSK98426.1 pyruvate,water dikinase [Murinocardiopsis flavida]
MTIIELDRVDAGMIGLVGGKAAGLGAMIRAGERVPAGFCVTTDAFDAASSVQAGPDSGGLGPGLRRAIADAYAELGAGPVAVRSSATAEDLPDASFAGQQDTVLGVEGVPALLDAVQRCRDSLHNERATAYRDANGIDHAAVRIAVVVQRMVDAEVAGVLFTANPVTGSREEMTVDAAPGLGTAVVDGSVIPDHYVLNGATAAVARDGCLDAARREALHAAGRRLQDRFGSPQDIEWAFDADGTLWLLQSRPITTLYPLPPANGRPLPRVYLNIGPIQGMHRPFTPMGMAVLRMGAATVVNASGGHVDPIDGPDGVVDIGGRMFIDITAVVRSERTRKRLAVQMMVQGPRVAAAVERVLADARFSPQRGLPFRPGAVARVALRYAFPALKGLVGSLARPEAARAGAFRGAEEIRVRVQPPPGPATAHERLRYCTGNGDVLMGPAMLRTSWPIQAGLIAAKAPVALLKGVAGESEIDTVLRGMPHNVTTMMDLELWRLASGAAAHRDLLTATPAAELAAMYRDGSLPDIGLAGFLAAYGHRAAAEVDVGLPRWAEDPTPVFAAIANYLRVTDPDQAADRRFAAAAREAEEKIGELVARARRTRPVRAALAGFLLRRARALGGLRELPKFAWIHQLAAMRPQLLLVGAELADRGLLETGGDIMFLDFREAMAAVDGADLRERVAARRAAYAREMRRRHVPDVLLSDGTDPEAIAPRPDSADGSLQGMSGAPGTVTGPARVIRDPSGAHLEPGEILVAPSTDPGWTPLFMTAGGLVTETGGPNAHGPTVAREYGIPAVIGIARATEIITTGQRITVDGSAGTVAVEPDGA